MKVWHVAVAATAVAVVGGAVFLFSRPAAARDAGLRAFEVSADCKSVRVIDPKAAEDALRAAGIAVFRGMDMPAMEFLRKAIKLVTNCEATDDMMVDGFPGQPAAVSVGTIASIFGDDSIEQVLRKYGGQFGGGLSLEGGSMTDDNGLAAVRAATTWIVGIM